MRQKTVVGDVLGAFTRIKSAIPQRKTSYFQFWGIFMLKLQKKKDIKEQKKDKISRSPSTYGLINGYILLELPHFNQAQ